LIRVLLPAALLGFVAASAWSLRLGYAELTVRRGTVPSIEKAIGMVPQADYYARLALLQSGVDDAGALRSLEHAVALNPSEGDLWIDLGLRYEAAGDLTRAEHCLLRAADEDRLYLPRWTLANYYFRRGDLTKFWTWARASAAMAPADALPLFRLCGQAAEDGRLMERLKIARPDLQASYLGYLMSLNRNDLIALPAAGLLETARESDVPILVAACDRLLEARQAPEAVRIWKGLVDSRKIPVSRGEPNGGSILTNGDFTTQPVSHGVDWRLTNLDGVSVASEESGGIRFTFSGREPEQCEPLMQLAPVAAGTDYEMQVRYRTSAIPAGTGLRWRIAGMDGAVLAQSNSLSSETEGAERVSFRTPPGCSLIRVSLSYERAPGTTRIEGFLVLENVGLAEKRRRS